MQPGAPRITIIILFSHDTTGNRIHGLSVLVKKLWAVKSYDTRNMVEMTLNPRRAISAPIFCIVHTQCNFYRYKTGVSPRQTMRIPKWEMGGEGLAQYFSSFI